MLDIPLIDNPFKNAKVIGPNVDPEVYHRQEPGVGPGHREFVISRSSLMAFRDCPARWIKGIAPKDSDSTDWGDRLDNRTLLPEKYKKRFVVAPATCKATKSMKCVQSGEVSAGDDIPWQDCAEAREWNKEQIKAGLTPITAEESEEIEKAAANLMQDPPIRDFFDCSQRQVMVVAEYHDRATKLIIPVKFLIDLVPDYQHAMYGQDLGDLKSARSARPFDWRSAVRKFKYDAQAAMFLDGYNAATGEERINFRHIIVENQKPFQTAKRLLSSDSIYKGRDIYYGALQLYCQCLASGKWPDYEGSEDWQEVLDGWGVVYPVEDK